MKSCEIALNNGMKAIVDARDYRRLNKYKWSYQKSKYTGYATTNIEGKTTYMHRLVTNAPKGGHVDHINRDGLNNTSANLRVVDRSLNMANARIRKDNTTGFKGLHLFKRTGRYQVHVGNIPIGYFRTIGEALGARITHMLEFYGEVGL